MHVTSEAALQQSLLALHLSPFCEQPLGIERQVGAPPSAPFAQ
jgi:hypothetical protein